MSFINKLKEKGEVMRNKVRHIAQGFNQQEGIDYIEKFAHVARLSAITILLSFAVSNIIFLYQMNVK